MAMSRQAWFVICGIALLVGAWIAASKDPAPKLSSSAKAPAARGSPLPPPVEASADAFRLSTTERLSDAISADPFAPLESVAGAKQAAASSPAKVKVAKKPVPAPVIAAAPPPAPPPLPAVNVIGSISGADVGGGKPVAFVQYQGSIYPVSEGDVLAGAYKVTAFSQGRLELLHLSTQQKQVVNLPPP
ncbi:hypothetical protein [Ramlibacter humi]|uniref:Uncharacterized protein n=1 Tax=Ramlibacter humi TaxID=2530451 RepID=A0A4Z0BD35_9BURK|nr:hypothetical protein [Ramlibacter humi]TFY96363.1 hypothetical protein EZ216_20730 [Ramlibacter humi]